MSIWTIVPVKPLNRAKSRLADALSPAQRYALSRSFLEHTLQVTASTIEIMGTLVISRDNEVLSIARGYDAKTILESEASDLNAALTRATELVKSWKVGGVLLLPVDLPLVSPDNLSRFIAQEPAQQRHDSARQPERRHQRAAGSATRQHRIPLRCGQLPAAHDGSRRCAPGGAGGA